MKTIQARTDRFEARIRDSVCPRTIRSLVRAMTADLDPEAIAALIRLLDHEHDDLGSIADALLRYGDAAEEAIGAYVSAPSACAVRRVHASELLSHFELRTRLFDVGCF